MALGGGRAVRGSWQDAAGNCAAATPGPDRCVLQVLLAGWGEVAHSVALRASECNDEEWAVKDPALLRCTGVEGSARAVLALVLEPASESSLSPPFLLAR